MKTVIRIIAAVSLPLIAATTMADTTRDCMLEGTVQKQQGASADDQAVNVKLHSVSKFDQDANCRVRKGEKMEFKLPPDPRLQDAEPGSTVKYRYRTESDGSTQAELMSVGT